MNKCQNYFQKQISLTQKTQKPMILTIILYCFLPNIIIVLGFHFPNIYKHIFSWIILIRFFKITLEYIDSLTIKFMSTTITFDSFCKMRNGVSFSSLHTLFPHLCQYRLELQTYLLIALFLVILFQETAAKTLHLYCYFIYNKNFFNFILYV